MSKTLADLCGNVGRETTCEFWCLDILRFPKVDMDSEATYYTTPGGHRYKNNPYDCVPKSMSHHGMGMGTGIPLRLESYVRGVFLESCTPDHQKKVKEAPCRGESQR